MKFTRRTIAGEQTLTFTHGFESGNISTFMVSVNGEKLMCIPMAELWDNVRDSIAESEVRITRDKRRKAEAVSAKAMSSLFYLLSER